ncbi:uncharacterized protein LOC114525644 isoform X1 [Dendronephthya gigantea]|uniref:uncharacterized protein LOC114525644 isoform X1 n=1 Tax=Dendronephthya gigantea TaxID=151771 RepID=UPI0010698C6E|nr:uncharacterized protein LOC114525644 isoform X1 [Dendronephthya gigantea]
MASSGFAPQLLINESELNEILRIIKSAKSTKVKIVGKLFGLWRNSLIQPVVQLVTGPGKSAMTSKEMFRPDSGYHEQIKHYMQYEHGLLHIGLWLSGSTDRYPKLNHASREFSLASPLLPQDGRYVVLMFVDYSGKSLEIEYHIIDRHQLHLSHVVDLKAKDILPGASSFRELEQVLDCVNHGSKFQTGKNRQTRHFTINMLQTKHPQLDHHRPRTNTAPATLMTTSKPTEQWYECDGGETLLRHLMDGFGSHDVHVNMSRDSKTRDLTLEVNGSVCLSFPYNFPTGQMSVTWLNDTTAFTRNPDQICQTIVQRVSNVISYETALSFSRTTEV